VKRCTLVIFDFDGTLANTGPLICACFEGAVKGTQAERTAASFRRLLGHPLDRVHAILKAEVPDFELTVDAFVDAYKRDYFRLSTGMTSLFPGVREALETISVPMAIASTKPTDVLLEQTGQLGIQHLFQHIQGTDGFPHKPNPEIIYRVWNTLPEAPEKTLFVGDSGMDMAAGRAAGVWVVGVTTGAYDRAGLLAAEAHQVMDSLAELPSLRL